MLTGDSWSPTNLDKDPFLGTLQPAFLRTEEGFLKEQYKRGNSPTKTSQTSIKQKPDRLNMTSNFTLAPKDRPYELNSFYDTFTKLGDLKSKLRD